MERSSALFEKGGSDRIPYITSLMYSMCNISTSHNKVKGDRLELPEWPCALLLASVVFMYAKPSWKQKLYSLCYYTSVGLQGHRVTLRAHQCSCLLLKLLSEKHLFLIKSGGGGASRPCNHTSHIVDQLTPVWLQFAHMCSGKRFEFIKCLYINLFCSYYSSCWILSVI